MCSVHIFILAAMLFYSVEHVSSLLFCLGVCCDIVLESDLVLKSNAVWHGIRTVAELAKHCYKWCGKQSKTCRYLRVIPARRLIGASGCLLLGASDRKA